MKTLYPALTWEESMAAMLLYGEELQKKIGEDVQEAKQPKIIPAGIAMGWIKNMIENGKVPGMPPARSTRSCSGTAFIPTSTAAYLVDLTWYAAFYRESPEGKVRRS